MAQLFWVNQEFNDSKDFDNLLQRYQDETKYKFGKNDSRTMTTHCNNLNKNVNDYPNLKYYYRYVRCRRGGKFVPKTKVGAQSRKTKSCKNNCPFNLHVTANLKRKVLVIKKWLPNHNHPPPTDDSTDDDDDHDDSNNGDNATCSNDHAESKNSSDNDSGNEFEVASKRNKRRGASTQKIHKYDNPAKAVNNNSKNQLSVLKILKKIKQSIEFDENTVMRKRNMLFKLLEKFKKLDKPANFSNESDAALELSSSAKQSPVHRELSPSPNNSPPRSSNSSPIHLELSPSPNNSPPRSSNSSPIHLELSSSPNNSPNSFSVQLDFSAPSTQLQHSDLTIPSNESPQNHQRSNLDEKSEIDFHRVPDSVSLKKLSPTSTNEHQESSNIMEQISVQKIVPRGRPKRQIRPAIGAEFLTYGIKKAKKA